MPTDRPAAVGAEAWAAMWADAGFLLARRVAEISDALDILTPRFDPRVAARPAAAAAAKHAAVIADAAQARLEDRPPPPAPALLPDPQPALCIRTMLVVADHTTDLIPAPRQGS